MISQVAHDKLSKLVPGNVLDLGVPDIDGVFQIGMGPDDWTEDMKQRMLVTVGVGIVTFTRKNEQPLQIDHVLYEGKKPNRVLLGRQRIFAEPLAGLILSRREESGKWSVATPDIGVLCDYSLSKFVNYTAIFAETRQRQNAARGVSA
jgi:hypothetical protein